MYQLPHKAEHKIDKTEMCDNLKIEMFQTAEFRVQKRLRYALTIVDQLSLLPDLRDLIVKPPKEPINTK